MVRTIISLDDDDKRWLDRRAAAEGVSMAEMVRRAIRRLRDSEGRPSRRDLLEATRGRWTCGDGLDWQRKLRDEWDGDAGR